MRMSVQRTTPKRLARTPMGLVTVLASALFATFVSPQLGLWGRGLRTALPLFILFVGITVLTRGSDIRLALNRHSLPIAAGVAFAGISLLRHLSEPSPTVLQNQGINAMVCVGVWIAVIVLRTVFPEALEPVRWISLLTLGVSLGMGIPLLLEQPGIGRLTMGNPMAEVYAAELYPKGVTNYSWYTPVAFAFPVIANWLANTSTRRLVKIIGWGMLLAAAIAALLSTFTMAMVLLGAGAFGWLGLVVLTGKSRFARALAALVLIGMLLSFPALYFFGSTFEATQFQVQKATRLLTGAVEIGLMDADETGRTDRFASSMETFLKYPLFGAWGLATTDYFVGGHSSWADTLAWQGLFGLSLWLAFLSPSWKRGRRPWSVADGAAGGALSWILLVVGGVLNPTLHSALGLLLIWLYDDNSVWRLRSRMASRQSGL